MKTRNLFVAVLLCELAALPVGAQKSYAIQGATIHTMAGPPIANGTVVIRDGKITAVGARVAVPSGAQVINARGLHVYPGLFDASTQLGLIEMGQTPATMDAGEIGDYKPQLVAAGALHVESEHIPVARANGITHTISTPTGGVIPGQGSLINLAGWAAEEMTVRRSATMNVTWPTLAAGGGFGGGGGGGGFGQRRPFADIKRDYDRRIQEITDWLDKARHYAQAVDGAKGKVERDLKLEALVAVVKGQMPMVITANGSREIKDAVEFCEKQKIKMILARGRDAWKVKDLLKQKNIPVLLGPTQALPATRDEAYDKPFSTAGELHAAGVKIAFATFDSSDSRTLPYEAANAVPFGLPHDEALAAITINPAQFFGVADKLGTIEQGKIGNVMVTTGDPLELTTEVRYLFINGQLTSTDNKQQRLWEKYRARP